MTTYEISNSELQTAQRCPWMWALTYHWHWQPRPEATSPVGKAQMGTNLHLALQASYGHGVDSFAALSWRYDQLATQHPAWRSQLEKEHELAHTMLVGFHQWVDESGVDSQLDVIGVESELEVPLDVPGGHDVTWRARLDQLVRHRVTGAYLVRDWKTVDGLAKANQLVRDQQMRFYSLLLSLLHRYDDPPIVVNGALYVMLKRSKRTTRAAPPFYEQVEILYNEHDLNSTFLRARTVTQRIVAWHDQLNAGADHRAVVYPNATDYCDWGCPFREVCPLLDDGSRWEAALQESFVQGSPYAYYDRDLITDLVRELT